jgi:hypothetical protein
MSPASMKWCPLRNACRQKDAVRKQDEAESRRQEAEAEAACKAAYDAAMRREQQRVASILAKQVPPLAAHPGRGVVDEPCWS